MSKAHRMFFNELAPTWDAKSSSDSIFRMLQHFGVTPKDHVLDIGAGTGCVSKSLTRMVRESGRIVAVDFSENMLRQARSNLSPYPILYTCSDACQMAFSNSRFDKIICYSSFPHFKSQECALAEFYRILNPGGRILICHNCCSRKLNHFHATRTEVVMFDKLPKSEVLETMCRDAGFSNVKRVERPDLYWVEAQKERKD